MTRTFSAMPHLNGNLMVAVDVETTGSRPGFHEIVQIAVVPLNSDIRPLEGVRPFYTNVRPLYPERAEKRALGIHGLNLDDLVARAADPDQVAEMLVNWFERLDMPMERNLVPLAHNWAFESSFLKAWLGVPLADKVFHSHARDGMLTALHMNDKAVFKGEKAPFNHVGLTKLCKYFGVVNSKEHDAFADCIAEAEVYRCLVMMDMI